MSKKSMSLSKRIKSFRKKNKLTQKQFSNLVGVSTCTICEWETGKNKITKNKKQVLELLNNGIVDSKQDIPKFIEDHPLVNKDHKEIIESILNDYKEHASKKLLVIEKKKLVGESDNHYVFSE